MAINQYCGQKSLGALGLSWFCNGRGGGFSVHENHLILHKPDSTGIYVYQKKKKKKTSTRSLNPHNHLNYLD